jgi:hypothetical protein
MEEFEGSGYRDLHRQVCVHLATMQFHSDLLDELSHIIMVPAQHFRQQPRAEALKRTGEVLNPFMSA